MEIIFNLFFYSQVVISSNSSPFFIFISSFKVYNPVFVAVKQGSSIGRPRATSEPFQALLEEMSAERHDLLLNNDIWWLSKGRLVERVCELQNELSSL